MPPRLIVNADDFGLTAGINRAISQLHEAAALTSATLMANGPAFEDALAIARNNPALGVGCHLVFVDGNPVADPASIPSLLARATNTLHPTLLSFVGSALLGSISEDDLVREGVAQVTRIQSAGIQVTHLDTHKHTHTLPLVTRALLRIAHQCRVHAIRNPFEPAWSTSLAPEPATRRIAVNLLRAALRPAYRNALKENPTIQTSSGTLAIAATGTLTRPSLQQILNALPASGTWELVVHPGYSDSDLDAIQTRLRASRDLEREILHATIPPHVRAHNVNLIHYGNL